MKKEKIPQFYVDSQTGLLSIQYKGQRFFTENLISIKEIKEFGINPEKNYQLNKKYEKNDLIDKNY